jgi:hypothetical protein
MGARSGLYGGCSSGVTPIHFFQAEHNSIQYKHHVVNYVFYLVKQCVGNRKVIPSLTKKIKNDYRIIKSSKNYPRRSRMMCELQDIFYAMMQCAVYLFQTRVIQPQTLRSLLSCLRCQTSSLATARQESSALSVRLVNFRVPKGLN